MVKQNMNRSFCWPRNREKNTSTSSAEQSEDLLDMKTRIEVFSPEDEQDGKDGGRTFLCGFHHWTPQFLQWFANIHWFLPFISIFCLLQGMTVNGFIGASIPHIEREFGLTSTQSGILLASNDLTAILFVLFVSYYGERGHKPTWLGIGSIVTGLGAFIFSIPKFMKGAYNPTMSPHGVNYMKHDTCAGNATTAFMELGNMADCDSAPSSNGYLAIFCVANMLMGIGATPLNTLGAAYLDENVSPKNSPIYIGIWYGMLILGPSIGLGSAGAFLKQYTNADGAPPPGITFMHPLWVGRWWYPFATLSWILVFNGFILMLFPKKMPGAPRIRQKAIQNGDIPQESSELEEIRKNGFLGFLKSTLILMKNKYLMVVLVATSAELFIVTGLTPFFPKFLNSRFGADPVKAVVMLGTILITGSVVGLVVGSMIMRSFNIKSSVKKATIISIVLAIINIGVSFSHDIPGCDNINLERGALTLNNSVCNNNCGCLKEHYNPVCANGITYLSPCVAGCTNKMNMTGFSGCSCIEAKGGPQAINNQILGSVRPGKCDQDCKNLIVFVIFIGVLVMSSLIGVTPKNMITLRSVPANQRSFAMGLHFLIVRLLGMLPGPIVVGKIYDRSCMVWKHDMCGRRAFCAEYELVSLSSQIRNVALIGFVINLVLFVVAYWLYKDPSNDENYAPALICNDGAKHNGDLVEDGNHNNGNITVKNHQQPNSSVQMSDIKGADM
ncbi:solute carrier organic anion transporter family member 4C1-like [Clytia hemisphaerica]|uniref:Solute carrier organic anion transporter family member n=1 Tax=Clytia hemisphaerica TaxID=252671 RepID=A0A7M5WV85_9CNID